jgi:divalent metal cation (Fe/Co/Zn/Cd) transporter
MAHEDTSSHIWASLRSNILITIAKLAAAAWTRSGAMLAEGIHTGADVRWLFIEPDDAE